MDILKRSLAPIAEEAWQVIDERARQVLRATLSARKFVDVDGPRGWDFAAITLGRLEFPSDQPIQGMRYGLHKVQPLVEARVPFELSINEIDNATRGAKDIDLAGLDSAAKKLAEFEENAIYYGFAPADITGLKNSSTHQPLPISRDPDDIVEKISMGLTTLRRDSIEGPYVLVVSPDLWVGLSGHVRGFPLNSYLENMLAGPVLVGPFVKGAFLASTRGGDMTLTIGQDIAIGYNASDKDKASLFFTESFTFQIKDPAVTITYDLA